MEDFVGFSFGGVDSSNLGLYRVSGGDRYKESILPDIKDNTTEVPGVNGEYYFGSNYGTRKISVEVAFDSLTEEQLRKVKRTFGTKEIKELIFDEAPYKKYLAKLESPIELSYVCFDEPIKELVNFDGIYGATQVWRDTENTQRIYKGEATIDFICYFPFAKSVYEVLPEGEHDWAISSGILSAEDKENNEIDIYDDSTGKINIYNAGDVPTGFKLYIPSTALSDSTEISYSLNNKSLILKAIDLDSSEIGIVVDTNDELIKGVSGFLNFKNYTLSGNIYNRYISAGQFFKLEPSDAVDEAYLQITNGASDIEIFYDYLYF